MIFFYRGKGYDCRQGARYDKLNSTVSKTFAKSIDNLANVYYYTHRGKVTIEDDKQDPIFFYTK